LFLACATATETAERLGHSDVTGQCWHYDELMPLFLAL